MPHHHMCACGWMPTCCVGCRASFAAVVKVFLQPHACSRCRPHQSPAGDSVCSTVSTHTDVLPFDYNKEAASPATFMKPDWFDRANTARLRDRMRALICGLMKQRLDEKLEADAAAARAMALTAVAAAAEGEDQNGDGDGGQEQVAEVAEAKAAADKARAEALGALAQDPKYVVLCRVLQEQERKRQELEEKPLDE